MTNARVIAYYDSRYVTGRFGDPRPGGRTHQGADLSHSRTPGIAAVPALLDGVVVSVWRDDPKSHGYGNRIETRTAHGIVSYSHLHRPSPLRIGDKVTQGVTVGFEGTTGFVSGPCCHIELAVNGVKRDPLPLIRDVLATTSVTPSPPPSTETEYPDMFIANVRGGTFYLVINGKAAKLGKNSGARESGIPILNFPDDWAVTELQKLVSGIA